MTDTTKTPPDPPELTAKMKNSNPTTQLLAGTVEHKNILKIREAIYKTIYSGRYQNMTKIRVVRVNPQ